MTSDLSRQGIKGDLACVLKGSAASLLLFLAAVLIIFAGPLPGIFAPFPVIFYSLKGGRRVGIAIVALVAVALSFIDPVSALFYILQCGLCALLLAEFLGRGWDAARVAFSALAIDLLAIVVILSCYGLWQGVDINGLIGNGIKSAISQSEAFYSKSGLQGEELSNIREGLAQASAFMARTYPALLVVFLGAASWFNLLLLKRVAHRLPGIPVRVDFSLFRAPEQLIWLFIAAGFAMLLDNQPVKTVALNIMIVIVALYFLQGVSVVASFFRRLRVIPFIRLIFYFMLALQPYLAIVVAAIGLFDLWCDFRTSKKQENL